MGTTQRIVPGVPGQPNWKDLNKSITHIAKTIENENELEESNDVSNDPEYNKIKIKKQKKIIQRRNDHLKNVFKSLIKTGGGKKAVATGKSKSLGKAGLKSTQKLVVFFSGVSRNGLHQTLQEIGFGSLSGKSIQDVIDYLLIYSSDSSTGMDETAANKASCEVLNEIREQAKNDLNEFEKLLKAFVDGSGLSDLICNYWGYYIFEHLSQRFQEKITQVRGESVSRETFKVIKDDIVGHVKVLNTKRSISKLDWHGADGKKTIQSIFESIINIICDEKDN